MIVVVGAGVLGLSVAEYLSRQQGEHVLVCSHADIPEASLAAAANLSTKGQLFARDPHFAFKLSGKTLYPLWLSAMQAELARAGQFWDWSNHYSQAKGRDLFLTQAQADRQWARVLQPEEELRARGFQRQLIARTTDCTIEYDDEAWIDATFLLRLLTAVCRNRGVEFRRVDACQQDFIVGFKKQPRAVIVCAGSQSPKVLSSWGRLDLSAGTMGRKHRLSYGGTLVVEGSSWSLPPDIALLEYVGDCDPTKVTLSGTQDRLFASSVSIACTETKAIQVLTASECEAVRQQMKTVSSVLRERLQLDLDSLKKTWRWGWRLGFGHKELVVEDIAHQIDGYRGQVVLAAGAHKSGFLFAPEIGSLVRQKLQS